MVNLLANAAHADGNRIEVWIRSFIPSVTSAEWPLTGPIIRAGKKSALRTMGVCYGTDDRSFSVKETDTSRVETRFQIFWQFKGNDVEFRIHRDGDQGTRAAATSLIDCKTGKVRQSKKSTLEINSMTMVQEGTSLRLEGKVAARNELFRVPFDVSAAPLRLPFDASGGPVGGKRLDFLKAPPIDYEWSIVLDLKKGTLNPTFAHDTFPAYEFYVRVANGPWRAIWRENYGSAGTLGLFSQVPGLPKNMFWRGHLASPIKVSPRSDVHDQLKNVDLTGKPRRETMERAEKRVKATLERRPQIRDFLVRFVMSGGLKTIKDVRREGWNVFRVPDGEVLVPEGDVLLCKPSTNCAPLFRALLCKSQLYAEAMSSGKKCGQLCRAEGYEPHQMFKWNGSCDSPIRTRCLCLLRG